MRLIHQINMTPRSKTREKYCGLLLVLFCLGVNAQVVVTEEPGPDAITAALDVPYPPDYTAVDENGVDMVSGRTRFNVTGVSIGTGGMQLQHTIFSDSNGFTYLNPFVDTFSGGLGRLFPSGGTCATTVPFLAGMGGSYERFCLLSGSSGPFTSVLKNGSTLIDNGDSTYTYTKNDGTSYKIDTAYTNPASDWGNLGLITEARYPSGLVLKIFHKTITYFSAAHNANRTLRRTQSVTLSNGLQIKYVYALNTTPDDATVTDWQRAGQVIAVNNAVDYCDPNADQCVLTQPWPSATYSWSVDNRILTVTDSAARVTRYTHDADLRVIGLKPPSSATLDKVTYHYCPHTPSSTECQVMVCIVPFINCDAYAIVDKVNGSTKDGQSWTYEYQSFEGGVGQASYTSQHPAGGATSFISYANSGNLVVADDRLGRRFVFSADGANKLTQSTELSGARLGYGYDDRGNVLTIRQGDAGDTAAPLLYSASYLACGNPFTCNSPLWTKDAKGNQTDYTYDALHGGILSKTSPAPEAGGIRPQTRFNYVQHSAWVKNASGQFVQSVDPIWLLESERFCRTGAALGNGCAVAGDEVVTSYDYGPNSGPNNLFLRGMVVTVDGQSRRSCYAYDRNGNRISETQPAAGLASCP